MKVTGMVQNSCCQTIFLARKQQVYRLGYMLYGGIMAPFSPQLRRASVSTKRKEKSSYGLCVAIWLVCN